ncbi:MAG TPA: sulfotransferase family 2 domain-containing protein [Pyrinomonadaceae bacterium]|nr:sulfotransferase family 2 domain-containing protein [Pyrinomonadaceae bacterium]
MISHTNECIFIHQRKCAGCSIINAFDFTTADPEWHFMNDGLLSPEYLSAPAGYFRFSIVRNPWDRFISGWKYCASTRERSLHDVLANLPREGHDYRHVTRPQHEILYDENGNLIVDYLMRFESLQQDFDKVCDIIGKPRLVLGHHNRGVRTHYSDYFDEDSRRIFLRHFARDVELFGYEY